MNPNMPSSGRVDVLSTILRHAESHRAMAETDAYSAQEAPRLEYALAAVAELYAQRDALVREAFSDGVILALQVISASGDMGSAVYEELLNCADAVDIYKRAEAEGMLGLSGLSDYLAQETHEPAANFRAALANIGAAQ